MTYVYVGLTIYLAFWALIYFTTKLRINVPVGVAVYGLVRMLGHVTYRSGKKIQYAYDVWRHGERERLPERPKRATSVTEINSVHNMYDPFDVVLGYDGIKAVKVNLRRHHTIIGSGTGGGKTNLLNSILIQLLGRGSVFNSVGEVYLIDMKNDELDYLSMWIPLLSGYATVDETGIGSAIELMENLLRRMEHSDHSKHVILLIDEMAFLTSMTENREQQRQAIRLLRILMSMYRTYGTVIGAVQHAKYEIVPTEIRVNMDRKIALMVESKDHAKTILGERPEKHELPWEPGMFLLKEPGKRNFIGGKSLLVQVPQEIEAIIGGNVEASLTTWQERLFWDMCKGLVPGGPTPGIRVLKDATEYEQPEIQAAKRHYAMAGALTAPTKNGESYLLAQELPIALGLVRNYVRAGKWEQDPPSLFRQTNGKGGDAEEE